MRKEQTSPLDPAEAMSFFDEPCWVRKRCKRLSFFENNSRLLVVGIEFEKESNDRSPDSRNETIPFLWAKPNTGDSSARFNVSTICSNFELNCCLTPMPIPPLSIGRVVAIINNLAPESVFGRG